MASFIATTCGLPLLYQTHQMDKQQPQRSLNSGDHWQLLEIRCHTVSSLFMTCCPRDQQLLRGAQCYSCRSKVQGAAHTVRGIPDSFMGRRSGCSTHKVYADIPDPF